MSRVARFRQADLTRAIRAAKACGARVILCPDGRIEIDPTVKTEKSDASPPVAPPKDFVL